MGPLVKVINIFAAGFPAMNSQSKNKEMEKKTLFINEMSVLPDGENAL